MAPRNLFTYTLYGLPNHVSDYTVDPACQQRHTLIRLPGSYGSYYLVSVYFRGSIVQRFTYDDKTKKIRARTEDMATTDSETPPLV